MYFLYFKVLFCVLIQLTGCMPEAQTKCPVKGLTPEVSAEMMKLTHISLEYFCPRNSDPKTYTECCNKGECCEPALLTLPPNDDWVLMVTGIAVISFCLILTILSVICCFWSKCPLYNSCRPSYTTSNIIVYSFGKEDPIPLMPGECNKGGVCKPCSIKIKKVQDV